MMFKYLKKAESLDANNPDIHSLWCWLYQFQKEYDKALAEGEKAIELSPNNAWAHLQLGTALLWVGRFEEAIKIGEKSIRLSPYCPFSYVTALSAIYQTTGRYEDSIKASKKGLNLMQMEGLSEEGNFFGTWLYLIMAEGYVELGRTEEARDLIKKINNIKPKFFNLEVVRNFLVFKNKAHTDLHVAALQKAGFK